MKIEIYAIGKLKKSPILTLIDDYQTRIKSLAKNIGFKSFSIHEFEAKKTLKNDLLKKAEADILLHNMPNILITLDEKGAHLNSNEFSQMLDEYKNNSYETCRFVIGGADGLCETVKQKAHKSISFGRLTWPHMFVRAMITEQIYRTMTILSDHPYHRD